MPQCILHPNTRGSHLFYSHCDKCRCKAKSMLRCSSGREGPDATDERFVFRYVRLCCDDTSTVSVGVRAGSVCWAD